MTEILVVAIGLGVLYQGLACSLQRRVLYPRPATPLREPVLPAEALRLRVAEGAVEAFLLRPAAAARPAPLVVFAHGNAELIDDWALSFAPLLEAGSAVLLVEYPGYGRSAGSPSQPAITQAFVAAYDEVVERPEVDPRRVVGYGRSLGGGAVCALALERPLAALILESTFTSVRDLARRVAVPGPLVLDPFDNLDALRRLPHLPRLVLHGERDEVIPFSHGEALAGLDESRLVRLPCGHNDCARPWAPIQAFLREQGVLR